MIGAAALAAAPTAAAKSYSLDVDNVTLKKPGVLVDVNYTCDDGDVNWLIVNVTELGKSSGGAFGGASVNKVTCDHESHKARVYVDPVKGQFAKGSKVRATVSYFSTDSGLSGWVRDMVKDL